MALELRLVDDKVAARWDETLTQYPDWSVFQTNAWLRFIEETQGVHSLRLGIFDGETLLGLWPAAEFRKGPFRPLGSPMKGWVTRRMGPASNGLRATELLESWCRFLKQQGFHHAQVSHPTFTGDLAKGAGLDVAEGMAYVCPIPPTEERILAQFHRSCRYYTRKALGIGVVVEETDDPLLADHFYYQLEDVFGKKGLRPTYPKSLIKTLLSVMRPTGRLQTIWAKFEGKVIGTAINVIGNGVLHALGWASLRSAQDRWPNENPSSSWRCGWPLSEAA